MMCMFFDLLRHVEVFGLLQDCLHARFTEKLDQCFVFWQVHGGSVTAVPRPFSSSHCCWHPQPECFGLCKQFGDQVALCIIKL